MDQLQTCPLPSWSVRWPSNSRRVQQGKYVQEQVGTFSQKNINRSALMSKCRTKQIWNTKWLFIYGEIENYILWSDIVQLQFEPFKYKDIYEGREARLMFSDFNQYLSPVFHTSKMVEILVNHESVYLRKYYLVMEWNKFSIFL